MNLTKLSTRQFLTSSLLALSVLAFTAPSSWSDDASTVKFNGQPLFDVLVAERVYSAPARAHLIQTNIENALVGSVRRGIHPIPVAIVNVNGHPGIQLAGYIVAVAADDSAKAAGMTNQALAELWASKLREALSDDANVTAYVANIEARSQLQLATSDEYTRVAPASKSTKVKIPKPKYSASSSTYVGMVGGGSEMFDRGAPQVDGQLALLPAGTNFRVRMDYAVSSETSQPGDMIEARTIDPITVSAYTIPSGSILTGHVVDGDPQRTLLGLGVAKLQLAFDTIRLPDGTAAPISARAMGDRSISGSHVVNGTIVSNGPSLVMTRGMNSGLTVGSTLRVQLERSAQVAMTQTQGAL